MKRFAIVEESVVDARRRGALAANAEDASLWRWFSALLEEGRVRWCRADRGWLISVDHKHVATNKGFDQAIRTAKSVVEELSDTQP